MKNILLKLGGLDRRIIFVIIGLSVLIPLLMPNLINFPVQTTKNTEIVFNEISKLKEDDKILICFAYGASTKPEIHPMAIALLNHLFTKGVSVYIMSLFPEGVQMSKDAILNIKESRLFNLDYGSDYVMFDYKVGGEVVIKNLTTNFREVYKQDIDKTSILDIPMMTSINSIEDFDYVFDFSAGVPGNQEWVQYACDPKNIPLSSGCTSIMVTDAIPYVESGQIRGILAGMPGAAEYEELVYNFLLEERDSGNNNINIDVDILRGKATSRMSSQSLAHLFIVLFIILGNLSYYYIKRNQKF